MNVKENYFSKKLKCGDMLDYSAEFFRQHLKKLLLLTVVFHVPMMIIINMLSSTSIYRSMIVTDYSDDALLSMELVYLLLFYVGILLSSAYSFTFFNAYQLSVSKYTYEATVNERSMRVGETLKYGIKKMGWLILFSLIMSAAVYVAVMAVYILFFVMFFALAVLFAGINPEAMSVTVPDTVMIGMLIFVLVFVLALVVVFIYFSVRLSFVLPAIAIDGCNCISAISRSFQLTKKRFFRTMWTRVLGTLLVNLVANGLLEAVLIFDIFQGDLVSRIMVAVASAVSALSAPMLVIIPTVIYINAKKQCGDIDFEERLKAEVESGV